MNLKTPVNKQTVKQHMAYSTWKYALMLIAAVFGWNLIYTVTTYRAPENKRIDVYIQSVTTSPEVMDAFLKPIWESAVPEMETVETGLLATGDDYTTVMQVSTYIAAGEGDIYLMTEEYFKQYASQGAFVELDPLVEQGLLDVSGIDTLSGCVKVATEYDGEDNATAYETHLMGIPLKSLYGFMTEAQIDNRNLYAAIMINNRNDENVIPFFNAFIQAGRGEKPDWIED